MKTKKLWLVELLTGSERRVGKVCTTTRKKSIAKVKELVDGERWSLWSSIDSTGGADFKPTPPEARNPDDPTVNPGFADFSGWMAFYGWRDVKDEVPPPLEDVIVAYGDPRTGFLIDIGWISTTGAWHRHTGDKARLDVQYWHELPLLPPMAKDNNP